MSVSIGSLGDRSVPPGIRPVDRSSWGASQRLKCWVAGTLLIGAACGAGASRHWGPHRIKAEAPVRGLLTAGPAAPALTGRHAAPVVIPAAARFVAMPRLRDVETVAPDDPFQPLPGELPAVETESPAPSAASLAAAAAALSAASGAVDPAQSAVKRPKTAPPTPAAPRADEIVLTGIVEGDPALAVLRYQGQSLFLKIGDQVADTWRLVEIKERSVLLQLGERRVEIPIQGGNSE